MPEGGKRLGRRLLDGEVAVDRLPGRAGGGERADVAVAALAQQPQRHPPDGAGRADDPDARLTHPCAPR